MKGLLLFGATTGKVHKARKCILFQNSPIEFQFRIGSINGPERSGMFVDTTMRFTCLSYSNSVCEVLVLRLHQPSLLLVLLYRPPSCSIDAIYQVEQIISKLTLPLPNIILLGDFNFPDIDWSCPDVSCEAASPLNSLSNSLLLNQQIDKPTRLSNILDLIFCPDELIKSISVADTYLSDHRILTVSTLIPMTPTKPNYFKPSPKYF